MQWGPCNDGAWRLTNGGRVVLALPSERMLVKAMKRSGLTGERVSMRKVGGDLVKHAPEPLPGSCIPSGWPEGTARERIAEIRAGQWDAHLPGIVIGDPRSTVRDAAEKRRAEIGS